jgi:hypothetical protein
MRVLSLNALLDEGDELDGRLRVLWNKIACAALDPGLWNWSTIKPACERGCAFVFGLR